MKENRKQIKLKNLRELIKVASTPPSDKPDEKYKKEQNELKSGREIEIVEKLKLENENLRQTIGLRKKLCWSIFGYICVWSVSILVLLYFHGFSKMSLSNNVIITLISTTTINIIGLFYVVVNYFFPPIR